MNPLDGTPAWVIHPLECGIPLQCDACAASHTRLTGNASCCRLTGEMFGKDTPIIILFLILWGIDRETFSGMCHLFITDGLRGYLLTSAGSISAKASRTIRFSMVFPGHIFASGLVRIATSRNSLSRNGTRPSTPHADKLLFARRQS